MCIRDREYQAERTTDDVLTVRVVPTSRFTAETVNTLRAELTNSAGPGMGIRIDVVSEIPLEPSGKRFVIRPRGGESPAGVRETVTRDP